MSIIEEAAGLARLLQEARRALVAPTQTLTQGGPLAGLIDRSSAIAEALARLGGAADAASFRGVAERLRGSQQLSGAVRELRRLTGLPAFAADTPGRPIPYRKVGEIELFAQVVPEEGAARRLLALHGGGDAPGMDAALEGLVMGAEEEGLEVWGALNGWAGLTDPDGQFVRLERTLLNGIRTLAGSILGTGPRHRGPLDTIDGIADPRGTALGHLRKFGAGLVVMGGNGSGLVAERLFTENGARIVFIPATIDGDIAHMVSVGFDSATMRGAECVFNLRATASSCGKVMVVEIMGGESGALPLNVAIAGGADFAIIPEVPIRLDRDLYPLIERALSANRDFTIVVGESADWTDAAGTHFMERVLKGTPPAQRKIGEALARTISRETGHRAQQNAPLHLLRGEKPVPSDISHGLAAGFAAARALRKKQSGLVIPPALVPRHARPLPLRGFFTNPQTTDQFRKYLALQWRRFFGRPS